mgnify:CR=1 FL=1
MITLAIDTATPAPSLAVLRDGEVLGERNPEHTDGAGRRVAQEIHLLLVDAGLVIGDVDEVVVGVGPGGFTGLRIGIATALGLGQALAIPVRGVASLEALALGLAAVCPEGTLVAPVIDAKRQEVFAAAYRVSADGGMATVIEPHATSAAALGTRLAGVGGPIVLGGDGVHRCGDLLGGDISAIDPASVANLVSAVLLARRARSGGARPASPLYLRLPDAEVNRIKRAHEGAPG